MEISIGKSCWSKIWKNDTWTWPQLVERLRETTRTHETVQEYRKMSKDKQSQIKDIGGFVGGHLSGGHPARNNVICRSMLTLDADFAPADFAEYVALLLPYAYCIYSTHKHTPQNPRLRLILPLSRSVSPDEYEAVARKVAESIDMEYFDDTTYQPSRLMYWPSTSKDGAYFFEEQEGEALDPDEILAEYADWKDVGSWPISSREKLRRKSTKQKQEDPTTKAGIIGTFCRTYTVQEAVSAFLSDVYLPTDHEDRFTYAEGSTAGGLVIYDDMFAYSHHSTDPAGGQLCNAFDLVRIHLYGEEDPERPDKPVSQLPSYKKMVELASQDNRVKKTKVHESPSPFDDLDLSAFDEDQKEEKTTSEVDFSEDDSWIGELEMTPKGRFAATIQNVVTILEHDPALKGCIAYDELAQTEVTRRDLPWRKVTKRSEQYMRDADDACLRLYLETKYKGADSKEKAHDAVQAVSTRNAFHPIRDYLNGLVWDRTPRVDRLIIDYLGTPNPEEYVAAVTRKTLVAAIARVMDPGRKYDQVLTLNGPQGIGKSTLFAKLGGEWFSDTIGALNSDTKAMESLQGVWIMELAELDAMKKSESSAVKAFISKTDDFYRSAYARRKEIRPRQVIFVATTNESGFLRDETGGRRWWVVDVNGQGEKSVFEDLTQDEIDQIWAEAVVLWKQGEIFYKLDPELEQTAKALQESHREEAPKLGMLMDFLELKLPADWNSRSLAERRVFVHGSDYTEKEEGTVRRTRVCVAEIWCELYQKELSDIRQSDTREISNLINQIPGWEKGSTSRFGPIYGTQKAFKRPAL